MRTDVRSTDPQKTPAGRPFGSHFMCSSNPTLWVFRIPHSSRLADWKHPPGDYHTPLGHPPNAITSTQMEDAMSTRPMPGTPAYFADRAEAFALIRELEAANAYFGPIFLGLAFRHSDENLEYMENLYHAANSAREEALCRARSHPTVREILVAQGRVHLIDGYDDPDDFDDDDEAFAIIRELEEASDDVSRASNDYAFAAWDTAYETFDGNFDQFVEHRGAQLHAADERYDEVLGRARSHPTVREILAAQGKEGLLKDWLLAA